VAKFNKGGVAWNKGIKKLNPYEYVFDCHGNPHVEVEIFSETHGSKIMRINVEHESLLKDGAVYLTYDKKMKSCYANQKINEKMTRFHRRLFPDIKPEERVDHIYGDTLDNRVDFLRATTSKENGRNTKNHRAGRLRGTCYDKKKEKMVCVH